MAKRGRKKKQINKINQNVVVAVMIIASILLTILIYTESGTIGKAIGPFLGGIMGYIKYILPIGVFIMALYINGHKWSISSRLYFLIEQRYKLDLHELVYKISIF